MPQNDTVLLSRLAREQVEFVIVGGVCGVLHGAPLVTFDLDVCCRFSRENLHRLGAAVKDLHAVHRLTTGKLPLELTDELCDRLKNLYLSTDLGTLDCLSTVAGIGDFDSVLKRSVSRTMSYGKIRILNLDALIDSKTALGREKDLDAVRLLKAIREKQPKELF